MKRQYNEEINIPEKVSCEFDSSTNILKCRGKDIELSRIVSLPKTTIKIESNLIKFFCEKGDRKIISAIKSNIAHIKNMFKGFGKKFAYKLEICHVHFPMSVKVDGDKLLISNFLGEKKPRMAKILPGTEIEVKGNEITVSSYDIEKAGQTAANIEKTVKVPKKDRRVFQDGIFIKDRPKRII